MTLRLTILWGVIVFLGARGHDRNQKTVTFHHSRQGERLGQAHVRTERDTIGNAASHGPTFTSCRLSLSTSEQIVLDKNTHETGFNGDDGSSFTLTWVGNGTGVILVLSTISAPIDTFLEGSSRLYRSTDHGKSFQDISHRINNTFIRKEFGVSAGPGNSLHVILTADTPIMGFPGGVIFTSMDAGVTFKSVQLPFHMAQPITFHYSNPDYLVVISIDGGLWLSLDFGIEWTEVHEGTHSFMWGAGNNLFLSFSPKGTVEADRRGELLLKRTKDLGKTFTTISDNIFSFGYIGRFLFTSVMEDIKSPRVIYVSSDQGNTFNKAQLPSASTEQFYSVLDGDEDMIFMHVDNPGDTYFGTVYTSGERGIVYSKSLERHLFGGERKSDFTNITSLRGVYLTNKLEEDGRIRTVISFDRGGRWRLLNKPENVECGPKAKICNLHIHGEHSRYNHITPMLPLSKPTATGLVLAHGSVGDSITSSVHPDVYVSEDGGYSWRGTLRGPHHYSILDSGGLLVAVEAHNEGQVKAIKFSTDQGQCWKVYNFTEQPFFFAGLASEPGTKAMNISVWGYRPEDDNQPMWVTVTIDFERLITRECMDEDYEEWLAHSTNQEDPVTDGCVLGYKETFRRLKKMSVCRNGRDYVVSRKVTPCPCTREDYLCDYGYYRHENTSECVKDPSIADQASEECLNGKEEELQTSGYHKVPGDKCEGGFTPQHRVDNIVPHCGKPSPNTPAPSQHFETPREKMVLILVCVGAGVVVLVAIASAFFTARRMVNANRSPPYRFSALQIQDDDNCIPTYLVSATSSNGTVCPHDSDDDLLS